MTQFNQMRQQLEKKESVRWRIRPETVFLVLIVILLVAIRLTTLQDTTVFYDEAVNITIGIDILSGDFSEVGIMSNLGTYIFPIVIASVELIGGNQLSHAILIIFNLITVVSIYLITYELIGGTAAIWALLLSGFAPSSINLSHIAVYDTLAIPLLALATLCIVYSTKYQNSIQQRWLVGAGFLIVLSLLTKYIVVLVLPLLIAFTIAIYVYRKRDLRVPLQSTFLIVAVASAIYGLLFYNQLSDLVVNRLNQAIAVRDYPIVLEQILLEIGISLALAAVGGVVLVYNLSNRFRNSHFFYLLAGSVVIVFLAISIPIYHLFYVDIQSVWKHLFYMQIFTISVAAYGITEVSEKFAIYQGKHSDTIKALAFLLLTVIVSFFAEYSIGRNWGFQQSWPNAQEAIQYLEQIEITSDIRILAEQDSVYEYYFDTGQLDTVVWYSTFDFSYVNSIDLEELHIALEDHYFDLIILDNFYTAELNQDIRQIMSENGYVIDFISTAQTLTTGQTITIEIYRLSGDI